MLQSLIKQKLTLELKNGFYVKLKKYFQSPKLQHKKHGRVNVNKYYLLISTKARSANRSTDRWTDGWTEGSTCGARAV